MVVNKASLIATALIIIWMCSSFDPRVKALQPQSVFFIFMTVVASWWEACLAGAFLPCHNFSAKSPSQIFHLCSVLVYASLPCTFCTSQLMCLASLYFCLSFALLHSAIFPVSPIFTSQYPVSELYLMNIIINQCKVSQYLNRCICWGLWFV